MSKPQLNLGPGWAPRLDREFFRQPALQRWALVLVVYVTLFLMVLAPLLSRRHSLAVGEVAPYDVEAPVTAVDETQTERLQAEARHRAAEVVLQDPGAYLINRNAAIEADRAAEQVFTVLRQAAAEAAKGGGQAGVGDLSRRLLKETGLSLSSDVLARALRHPEGDLERLSVVARALLSNAMLGERITDDSLMDARRALETVVRRAPGVKVDPELAVQVVRGLLRPNLTVDPERLARAEEAAVRSVEPIRILKGQTIIRKGDVVTPDHVRVLESLGLHRAGTFYPQAGGAALATGLLVLLMVIYLRGFHADMLGKENLLALLGFIVLLLAFTARVLSTLPWPGAGYLIPVAFGTMLAAILLDSRLAVMVAVVLSVFVGLVTGQELKYVLVALAGGLAGVFGVSRVSQRGDLMRAGFIVGAVTGGTIAAVGLFSGDYSLVRGAWLGLANGIISSILAIGSLAYLETIFGITSAVKLLELSNPNQPLLRRLLLEAPGTYHHAIMVGNLAEAAAEMVHADPLLSRVGAYYHDIGKVRRPYFFAENQFSAENPHDKIAPGLSTLIITNHVKDGVELARERRLPDCVVDFIRQHHGTDLVRYFFRRAVENSREAGLSERDFRYQGPKPQSKETAIVMLADSVEAAVRALQRPTPGRIEGLVRKLLKDRLVDGQLDESNLTLKDLDRIAEAFVRVLSGMFHTRVEYPENLAKELEGRKG
ncbi:MAG: HD family phosphohydrolase [Chitinophagales bacterium]